MTTHNMNRGILQYIFLLILFLQCTNCDQDETLKDRFSPSSSVFEDHCYNNNLDYAHSPQMKESRGEHVSEEDVDIIRSSSKRPIFLFPGLASTKLTGKHIPYYSNFQAWKRLDCPGKPDIEIGDRVWLNVGLAMMSHVQSMCWVNCMMLNATTQEDLHCKLRPDSGMDAIMELEPGLITGPLSAIFRELVTILAHEFDYDTNSIFPIPYDWRLSPLKLEQRDLFFTKLKRDIEKVVATNNNLPGIAIAHIMGNNLLRYFLKWIEYKNPTGHRDWIDRHFKAYIAVGAPLLGSAEAARALITGITAGLPITEPAARNLGVTWGSGPWVMPVAYPSQPTKWPLPIAKVHFKDKPSRNYRVETCRNALLWEELAMYDSSYNLVVDNLLRNYWNDPVFNPLKAAPERPPIENVYCVYGINLPSEVSYEFAEVDPKDITLAINSSVESEFIGSILAQSKFILKKTLFEHKGIIWETTNPYNKGSNDKKFVKKLEGIQKSGDGTVPYSSLSWCHTWHPPAAKVEEVYVPSVSHNFVDDPIAHVAEQYLGNFMGTFEPSVYKYISSHKRNNKVETTAVIEIESIQHREIIKLLTQMMSEEARKEEHKM